jgi:hypothetical protein
MLADCSAESDAAFAAPSVLHVCPQVRPLLLPNPLAAQVYGASHNRPMHPSVAAIPVSWDGDLGRWTADLSGLLLFDHNDVCRLDSQESIEGKS